MVPTYQMKDSGQLHTMSTLPWLKNTRYPLERILGEPQAGLDAVANKRSLAPRGNQKPSCPASLPSRYTD
jgi:hypothetical protein